MTQAATRSLSLRIDPRASRDVINKLELMSKAASARIASERRSIRLPFDAKLIFIHLINEHQQMQDAVVVPRNLSAHGVGFVHNQYMHVGRSCHITLPRLDGEWTRVAGRILNCRHVSGRMHEVGVRLDEPIDLTEFAQVAKDLSGQVREEYARLAKVAQQRREKRHRMVVITDEQRASEWANTTNDVLGTLDVITSPERIQAIVSDPAVTVCIIDRQPTVDAAQALIESARSVNEQAAVFAVVDEESRQRIDRLTTAGATACFSADTQPEEVLMRVLQACDILATRRPAA